MLELKEVAYYAGITVSPLVFLGYLANKFYFSGGVCKSKNRLDGKVVIITGANTGIGYETALDLVKRGARVILACRDLKKADAAADKIRLETGSKNVFVEQLDLSSFESIRDFTRRFKANFTRLDILINNAGVDLDWDDLQSKKSYPAYKIYQRSKLANCLFTVELAKKYGDKGITAVSLHPGVVYTDIISRELRKAFDWKWLLFNICKPLIWLCFKNCKQGAETTIHCAVDDDVPNYNGKYFSDCQVIPSSPQSVDENSAKKLWEISEKLSGFEY